MVVNVVVYMVNICMLFNIILQTSYIHIYTVKMTESDHKKAYQEYLKEKNFRTVVIYFAIKNKYVFIKYAVVIYVVMCC
jgi:CRISPR/Cas system-associated exonuclease Cas4 (RecB family)